ncbi:MAG: cobalamin biosynthesis protein CobD [Deltaproteobacteria bacterium]|nr:cobalamin biosynthesis protein CobD [Deltaproteobacteria bacterium]
MPPLALLAACMLDLLLGDPEWFPHPVVLMGRLIVILEKAARKLTRPGWGHRIAGGGIVLIVVVFSFETTFFVVKAASVLHPWFGSLLSVFLAWTTLAARTLHREAAKVEKALREEDLEKARRELSGIVGRDTSVLSREGIIRAAVETVAENSSDGVIAPLFYLILGGAPLAMAYKAVNTLDSMLGYKDEACRDLGFFPARFDDLVNFIPARVTGLLLVVVSFLWKGSGRDAFRILRRDGRKHSSPNAGIPEAAAAGALGIQLGGRNFYGGVMIEKPVIGEPVRPLTPGAVRGAVQLMYGAFFLMAMAGVLALMLR